MDTYHKSTIVPDLLLKNQKEEFIEIYQKLSREIHKYLDKIDYSPEERKLLEKNFLNIMRT